MNSWSLLHDYMNETHDDAPWLDCMDGLKLNKDEEVLQIGTEKEITDAERKDLHNLS